MQWILNNNNQSITNHKKIDEKYILDFVYIIYIQNNRHVQFIKKYFIFYYRG